MANVIDFANASQTISFIEETNALAQASGWDVQTMATELGAETASNGMRLVGFESQAGAGAITEFNAGNAADAYASYIESGGLAAGSGAAAQSTSIGAGTVALAQTGAGTASVVGVATGGAGLFAAGAAPIFGVALGAGLYEAAPDFWTQLSQTLLPWVWEATDTFAWCYDENGNTYIPQQAIEAMRSLLSSTGVGDITSESAFNVFYTSYYNLPILFTQATEVLYMYTRYGSLYYSRTVYPEPVYICVGTNNNNNAISVLYAKDNGNSLTVGHGAGLASEGLPQVTYYTTDTMSSFTYNNKTVYYYTTFSTGSYSWTAENINAYKTSDTSLPVPQRIAWDMVYGFDIPTTYPLETWEGEAYPSNPNTIDVYIGDDALGNPQYETYQQVAMPIGDPLTTNDPLIQPSPYTNPLPEINPDTGTKVYPAIDPYVNPYPSPQEFPAPNDIPEGEPGHIGDPNLNPAPLPSVEEVPQPATEAVPDPAVDPSAEPVPESIPENPAQPSGFPTEGTSPTPILPIFPLFPTGDASLYHVYNPTNAQLQQFGSWLWTTFSGNLIDTLSKLFNNPMDAVISLQEFYGTPNIQGNGTIRCGYLDSEVPSALVGDRYSSINCGSIIVPEYYGNYLDYTPYTQVIVYLPFVGFMSLNADDIIGNAVNIKYNIDSYTGSVIAIITVARSGYESVMYQFEGNCSVDVPVTGGQQSSIKGAIIGGISGAVAGGVAGAAVGAVLGGLSSKNDVQHSGSFSASYGAMGAKIPFIVVRRPVQKIVLNYNESYGFPAHKMVYVGNCRGYLRAREVRVLSTTATNEEKAMIVEYLLSGVYVKN